MPDDYLEHYGVLGMKWGVRRYQPYPKGEKKGVYLGDKYGHEPLKYKSLTLRKITDRLKRGGKEIALQFVPPYTLYVAISQIRDQRRYVLDGKDYTKTDGPYEKLKNVTRKAQSTSPEVDVKLVNPGNEFARRNNCGFCTAAMEMRRRGYDVQARRKACGITDTDYMKWFDGVQFKQSVVKRVEGETEKEWVNKGYDALCKKLEKNPNGSRGFVGFAYRGMSSGHTLFWEVQNGSVTFYDAQSGKKNPGDVFSFSNQAYTYGRLDNCKLKPEVTTTCVSRDLKKRLKEESKK